nr:MAG TPA: hypothetical protein [Caudoviricetes sp.]
MKTIELIVPDEVVLYSITLVSTIGVVKTHIATFTGNVEDKSKRKFAWSDSSKTELIAVEE